MLLLLRISADARTVPRRNAVARDGWMSIFLHKESDKGSGEIAVNIAINTRDVFGAVVNGSSSSLVGTFHTDTEFTNSWGWEMTSSTRL